MKANLRHLCGRIRRKTLFAKRRIIDRESGVLYFAPTLPRDGCAIKEVCAELGWSIHFWEEGKHPVIFWPGNPEIHPPQPQHWVNGQCGNINKDTVAAAFEAVFERSYLVNPETHQGTYVEKSIRNATHDGRVLAHPKTPNPGFIYLRLVNNVFDEEVEDLRIIYFKRILDFTYVKRRPLTSRFKNKNSSVSIASTSSLFSATEIYDMERMCEYMGMEYGEADVLRDRNDGQLYVVDMNRTPHGPPNGLPRKQARLAVKRMASAFAEVLK